MTVEISINAQMQTVSLTHQYPSDKISIELGQSR